MNEITLAAGHANGTVTPEPTYRHAFADCPTLNAVADRVDTARDFMSRHERERHAWECRVDEGRVGSANATRLRAAFLVDDVPGVQIDTLDVPMTAERYAWKCKVLLK